MTYPLVIIGGGLSGLAAGIRFARFGQKVLILEKHRIAGGLNSYYTRHGQLLETGLHAMTNFALPRDKHAPLNRLFRQLKLPRKQFVTHQQQCSEILFQDKSLLFSNDLSMLEDQIGTNFPQCLKGFQDLVAIIRQENPFLPKPRQSARQHLGRYISDPLLIDMLLCPLMIYGNAEEHDMDYFQFVIMFRSIFLEGFFRPAGTIKDLLDMLTSSYLGHGGEIRYNADVQELVTSGTKVNAVRLADGQEISCDKVLSTAGAPNTMQLLPGSLDGPVEDYNGRMSFMETIYLLPREKAADLTGDRTIIFFNLEEKYRYCRPDQAINPQSGVICFPENFHGLEHEKYLQIRVTNPANYQIWQQADQANSALKSRSPAYQSMKKECARESLEIISKIIGNFSQNIVYQDTFTPLTIEKFTGKAEGAVYGSPKKIKEGRSNYDNLFLAGTDQGFLGIVGSMLSGISMVNQHIL